MKIGPTQKEIDKAAKEEWESYDLILDYPHLSDERHKAKVAESIYFSCRLLIDKPEYADDRHKQRVAEDEWYSYYTLEFSPDQANDAIRQKANGCGEWNISPFCIFKADPMPRSGQNWEMIYEPTQVEIDEAANDAWYSYYLLRDRPEMADDRHKKKIAEFPAVSAFLLSDHPEHADDRHRAKVAEDAYWSWSILKRSPDQANDAIRKKAKEWIKVVEDVYWQYVATGAIRE